MTEEEYQRLQARLSKKLDNNNYSGNKKQIYKEAILSAKLIVQSEYHEQQKRREKK